MTHEAQAIIADFLARGWDASPEERTIALATTDRGAIPVLVEGALEKIEKSVTFIDFAISFIDERELDEIVARALQRFEQHPTSTMAESILARVSLQVPHLLTARLRDFWRLFPNPRSYCRTWPWRCADDAEIATLLEVAASEHDAVSRAWQCLLQTRRPAIVGHAATALATNTGHISREGWLEHVGFADEDGELVQLHQAPVWHVRFPPGFLDTRTRPPWIRPSAHPTWSAESRESPIPITVGGQSDGTCPFCHDELRQLLDLPVVPAEEPADRAAPGPLRLVACLSCLGSEIDTLFYDHVNTRVPVGLNPEGRTTTPQFLAGPLRETKATIVRIADRWAVQDWGFSNGRENLHRVGGEPSWIQSAEYPKCLRCSRRMRFIAQLDSDLPTENGGEWLWGSGGICYAFWCSVCRVSAVKWQCT